MSAIELEDYIALVLEHHPFFQKEELALNVEYSRRQTLLPRSEWLYSLNPRYTIADAPVASEFLQNLSQTAGLEAGLADPELRFLAVGGIGEVVQQTAELALSLDRVPPEEQCHSAHEQHGVDHAVAAALKLDLLQHRGCIVVPPPLVALHRLGHAPFAVEELGFALPLGMGTGRGNERRRNRQYQNSHQSHLGSVHRNSTVRFLLTGLRK